MSRPAIAFAKTDVPQSGVFVVPLAEDLVLPPTADALDERCPNCGGELVDRPTRARRHHAKSPPSAERRYRGS